MKITHIHARQILDSRGNPTVEADVTLADGSLGRAAVPSGASTGAHEALERRDHEADHFHGSGVLGAIESVNSEIARDLVGRTADQSAVDHRLCELDGTPDKHRLGANAILAVSLALAHARAAALHQPVYQLFGPKTSYLLPVPMMNIVNGGKHAAGSTDVQEFMILPVGAQTFHEAVETGDEIFQSLKALLSRKGYATTVGDEGGFAPSVQGGNREALDLIEQAVTDAGFQMGRDILFGLDVAASELYVDGQYHLQTEGRTLTSEQMIEWLVELGRNYPIISIEDGLGEDDWTAWRTLTGRLGASTQLVGDDLFVTNTEFLARGITDHVANAILIKPNQIGTLTETVEAVQMAQRAGYRVIISHRSGETEDVTIAHLAVGLSTGQIKTGSLSRTDRVAKYNELMRIEEELGSKAHYAGRTIYPAR